MLLKHLICWARSLAWESAGKSNAARMAIMAITTSSSMRVKPRAPCGCGIRGENSAEFLHEFTFIGLVDGLSSYKPGENAIHQVSDGTRRMLQTICGWIFSGFTPRIFDCLPNNLLFDLSSFGQGVKRRNDGGFGVHFEEAAQRSRVSLRPKPSVPSVIRPPGTHGAIWSGTIFMLSETATNGPFSFASTFST